MTCRELVEIAPLYLSGELEGSELARVHGHLAECRNCAREMDQLRAMDAQVRESLAELPDASGIQKAVRRSIGQRRAAWWRLAGTAAAVIAVVALAQFGLKRSSPGARVVSDAFRDHQAEVIDHQPRRWRTNSAEIETLAARYGLADVSSLAPAGYRLEHAKMCGLDHQPALHLVFTNGSQELSVFVRARVWEENGLNTTAAGPLHAASFQNNRFAVIATGSSNADCMAVTKSAASL